MNRYREIDANYGLTFSVAEKGTESSGEDVIAEIGKHIVFDANILRTYCYEGWELIHHDLLVVCAAVEFADRYRARRSARWSRSFNATIPVYELNAWKNPVVLSLLVDTLHHLTGDNWHFSFVQAVSQTPNEPCQRQLPFDKKKQFAIAYSDGLDSRCVSGIFEKKDNAVRVRVSANRDKCTRRERPFDLIPFEVKLSSSRESSVRSRGFKFAAITAIAGQLSGVSEIIVPESGQGALGPVLLPLHNVYPDYRNHPTFFRKMEQFIKSLLGHTVSYMQPRLWSTKGQTISEFLSVPGKSQESVLNTRSCWQSRHNVRVDGKLRQCGLCAACLLRRMSMHAARVNEPLGTYTCTDLTAANYEEAIPQNGQVWQRKTMVDYGSAGARHLHQLGELATRNTGLLRIHSCEIAKAIGAAELETRDNLTKLLTKHAEEWHEFVSAQGKESFLYNWTKGGRYGRSE